MKTTVILLSIAMLSACKKESRAPLTNEASTAHCYYIYDAETGKPIKGAQIEIDLDTKTGSPFNSLLFSDKKGNAYVNLPETEEFHLLKVNAPGYLTESFSINRNTIALIKPCTLKLNIRKNDENKTGELLIIDFKISSEQSEQILLKGNSDTTIVKKIYPRGKHIRWIYNNKRDSVSYNASGGTLVSAAITL
jgi:hypothetical protein